MTMTTDTPTEAPPSGADSLLDRLKTDVLWHRRRGNETIARDIEEAVAEIERLQQWKRAADAWHAEVAPLLNAAPSACVMFALGKWWGERPWLERGAR